MPSLSTRAARAINGSSCVLRQAYDPPAQFLDTAVGLV